MSGFEELDDGAIIWEDTSPSNIRVDAVVYLKDEDRAGHWRPHSVFGQWNRQAWTSDFDCNYVGRQLYYHDAGGGQPYATAYENPDPCPARIWVRDGVDVVDGSVDNLVLGDEALRARGYLRVHGPMPDPFAGALEGEVSWCEVCETYVHEDDTGHCCVCEEPVHVHLGSAVAIVDPSEGGLDGEPGVYAVLRQPFMTSSLIGGGWFHVHALARVGDLPAGVDTGGYAGAPLCRSCSPEPVSLPSDLTADEIGILGRLSKIPGYQLNARKIARVLDLGARVSISSATPEVGRMLAEVRRRSRAGDAAGVRLLVESALEEYAQSGKVRST